MEFTNRWFFAFAVIPFVILAVAIYIMESTYQEVEAREIEELKILEGVQSQKIISDFKFLKEAVEVYPDLPDWKILTSIDKIDEEKGGIPQNDEKIKRDAAGVLISEWGFQSFGITLADGRMYFLEPFEHQSNLSKLNFADREWFQGVLSSRATYVSDVFISDASGHPIIVISTPIFSNEGEIIGMWGGSLDLEYLSVFLNEVKREDSQIFLIDENNLIIAHTGDHSSQQDSSIDSSSPNDFHLNGNLVDLKSYEIVLDEEISILNKEWKMVTIISEAKLSPFLTSQLQQNYLLIISMSIFIIGAEYLLFQFLRKNFQLNININENRKLLIKQEKMAAIGELASRIAHDIRNPLSNIRMSIKLIQEKLEKNKISNEEIGEKLKIAIKNVERISHQVDNVLDYVKDRKLNRHQVPLYSFIEETIQSIPMPQNITVNIGKSKISAYADPIQLQIVFNNILLNAIQALGKEKGEIKIIISEEVDNIIIKIENSGPPIPEDILPHIFESMVTTKEIGTGLGLASSKRIIENHGGTISVEGFPVTFTITLPKS